MTSLVELRNNKDILIGVDGGVNLNTINDIYKTGIDITIVGSALYGADDITGRFNDLMKIRENH